MRALITVNMDNAAFDEHPPTELARILAKLASDINITATLYLAAARAEPQPLRDANGNKVGHFIIED